MRMPPTGCAWWLVDDVADVAATEKAEAVGHRRRPAVANNTRAAAMVGMVGGGWAENQINGHNGAVAGAGGRRRRKR